MMTTAKYRRTLAKVARSLADAFISDTRTNGKSFIRLAYYSPDWMRDATCSAHDCELPNDWVYAKCADAAEHIANALEGEQHDSASDIDCGEWADSETDIYNSDRLKWVSANLYRAAYVDDAMSELGATTLFEALGYGQYRQLCEIYGALCSAIDREAEVTDDDGEED